MIPKNPLWLLTLFWLPVAGHAQQNDGVAPLQIRAVLHDPVHPTAELYLTDRAGAVVRLNFLAEGFSKALLTLPVNGSLVLYDKAGIDPQKPMANMAAICKIPPNTRRAMVIVLPAPAGEKPAYRMVLIDDSQKAFPKGESRVLPLVTVETAIQAGEHRLPIHPGVITNVPVVKKINPYNLAQTNFYYKQGDAWVAFAERQLQYLDAYRRVFIIHVTPGALQPAVTTIVDTAPAVLSQ
jgi:hypothetical protein